MPKETTHLLRATQVSSCWLVLERDYNSQLLTPSLLGQTSSKLSPLDQLSPFWKHMAPNAVAAERYVCSCG